MKFRVERDALAEAVAWAARSLPARPTVPVLAGLLLETTADGLVLSSFDYEVSGRVDVDADVQDYPSARAKARGIDVDPLVNALLKKDIELIKAAR